MYLLIRVSKFRYTDAKLDGKDKQDSSDLADDLNFYNDLQFNNLINSYYQESRITFLSRIQNTV